MTKLVVETKNDWTKKKIEGAIHIEIDLLRKAVQRTQSKLQEFENKYHSCPVKIERPEGALLLVI
ncbi:MAG: hypothetical protein AB1632_02345 [Nitrospirota bacterium]